MSSSHTKFATTNKSNVDKYLEPRTYPMSDIHSIYMITIKGVDPSMIANNLEPLQPVHPGEMIKDEIECRGISQKKLAEQTGIPYTALNEVLNGKRPVSTEYALLLEAALGVEAGIWIKTQADYDLITAKRNQSFAKRLAKVREIAAML